MTTVRKRNVVATRLLRRRIGVAGKLVGVLAAMTLLVATARAQSLHHIYHDGMSPGAIGAWQLQRGGSLAGHFQAVEITLPKGASVSFVVRDHFEPNRTVVTRAGLLVGRVYRFKVTDIPLAEGMEVFPTLEIIDRLCPPPGAEWKFPVPVELTRAELQMALDGKFVTRVIYVEDPDLAIPASYAGDDQPWFDVGDNADAIQTADLLGRPIAILRMGSRVPADPTKLSPEFTFGSPPLLRVRTEDDAALEQYDKALKQALQPNALQQPELVRRLMRDQQKDEALGGKTR